MFMRPSLTVPLNSRSLPPGGAYTTSLSCNPLTWLPLKNGKMKTPKSSAF